jgi:hypothetical protein
MTRKIMLGAEVERKGHWSITLYKYNLKCEMNEDGREKWEGREEDGRWW